MLPVFFAPMEGLTDAIFRRVHNECFTGVARYYIPFISPTQHLVLTGRERRNVDPAYNAGVPCVPQVLTRDPEHFLWAAKLLADMGYDEANLNAGCPSGTVTAKGKGAGVLRDVEQLDRFLDAVCAQSPIPVSVKTRIGFYSTDEWDALLKVYARYPLKMLIVHPRTCKDRYDPGTVEHAAWLHACESYPGRLVFNGDLFTPADVAQLLQTSHADGVMLGRGLVANPALARVLGGGAALQKQELVHFHDRLAQELQQQYQPDIVFMKLRVVMKHLACCFEGADKLEKQIRKTRRLEDLLSVDACLFDTCELKPTPAFVPDELRKQEWGSF